MDELHIELLVAIEQRDASAVRRLIEQGADVEARPRDPASPVEVAARTGDSGILRQLLAAGADPAATFEPPLVRAVFAGHLEVAEVLLAAGVDVDGADDDGDTALYLAASRGDHRLVELLLERGARTENSNWPPLLEAAERGHEEVCSLLFPATGDRAIRARARRLLERNRALKALKNAHPRAPDLFDAIEENDIGRIRRLLAAGVPADAVRIHRGQAFPALRRAAALRRCRAVEILLAAGAAVDLDPAYGERVEPPLLAALQNGHIDLAIRLLKAGADGSVRIPVGAEKGWTALMLAAAFVGPGQPSPAALARLSRRLVRAGADLEAENAQGRTALVLAARRCEPEIAAALLSLGADPERRDHQDNTAWMHAAFRRVILDDPEVVERARRTARILERRGPLRQDRRQIELMTAAGAGQLRQVERALANGAAVDHRVEDWTALGLAAAAGHADVVRRLLAAGADPGLVDEPSIHGSRRLEMLELLTR